MEGYIRVLKAVSMRLKDQILGHNTRKLPQGLFDELIYLSNVAGLSLPRMQRRFCEMMMSSQQKLR